MKKKIKLLPDDYIHLSESIRDATLYEWTRRFPKLAKERAASDEEIADVKAALDLTDLSAAVDAWGYSASKEESEEAQEAVVAILFKRGAQ